MSEITFTQNSKEFCLSDADQEKIKAEALATGKSVSEITQACVRASMAARLPKIH